MPKCTKDEMGFGRIGRRQITASFDGGEVCSDGDLMLLRPALFILATTLALPEFAADDSATSTADDNAAGNMDILRQKVNADKMFLVANNMNLTDAEAKAFWPIYDAY